MQDAAYQFLSKLVKYCRSYHKKNLLCFYAPQYTYTPAGVCADKWHNEEICSWLLWTRVTPLPPPSSLSWRRKQLASQSHRILNTPPFNSNSLVRYLLCRESVLQKGKCSRGECHDAVTVVTFYFLATERHRPLVCTTKLYCLVRGTCVCVCVCVRPCDSVHSDFGAL